MKKLVLSTLAIFAAQAAFAECADNVLMQGNTEICSYLDAYNSQGVSPIIILSDDDDDDDCGDGDPTWECNPDWMIVPDGPYVGVFTMSPGGYGLSSLDGRATWAKLRAELAAGKITFDNFVENADGAIRRPADDMVDGFSSMTREFQDILSQEIPFVRQQGVSSLIVIKE